MDISIKLRLFLLIPLISSCTMISDFERVYQIKNCKSFAEEMTRCFIDQCEGESFDTTSKNYINDYIKYICDEYYSDIDNFFDQFDNFSCKNQTDILDRIKNGRDLNEYEINSMNDICNQGSRSFNEEKCYEICDEIYSCYHNKISDDSIFDDVDACAESCLILDYPGFSFFDCISNNIDCNASGMSEENETDNSRVNVDGLGICLNQIDDQRCKGRSSEINDCFKGFACSDADVKSLLCDDYCGDQCLLRCGYENDCIRKYPDAFECLIQCNMEHSDNDDLINRCIETRCAPPRYELNSLYECANSSQDDNDLPCMSKCLSENNQKCLNECNRNGFGELIFDSQADTTKAMIESECNYMLLFEGYSHNDLTCSSNDQENIMKLAQLISLHSDLDINYYGCGKSSSLDEICNEVCAFSKACDNLNPNQYPQEFFYTICPAVCSFNYLYYLSQYNCFFENDEANRCNECTSLFSINMMDVTEINQ